VVNLMERHFDGSELVGVIAAVDELFAQRLDSLNNSLEIGRMPRSFGNGYGHGSNGRKPRHLH